MSVVSAESGQVLRVIFDEALDFLRRVLGADRALVLSIRGEANYRGFRAWATHGLSAESLWDKESISLKLFDRVIDGKRPLLLADAQDDLTSSSILSVNISGIRSVLCFPFFDAQGRVIGLLYADSLVRVNQFRGQHISAVRDYIRGLEKRLQLLSEGQYSRAESLQVDLKVPTFTPRKKRSKIESNPQASLSQQRGQERKKVLGPPPKIGKIRRHSVVFFLRCLATTTASGIVLDRGVSSARPGDDPEFHRLVEHLVQSLQSGASLSESLSAFPKVFTPFHTNMVRVGEETGSLHELLQAISDYEEERVRRRRELEASLAYPLLLLSLCTVLLLVGPPYLLQGQRRLLSASGAEMPTISRWLFEFSEFLSGPGLVISSVTFTVLGITLQRVRNQPKFRSFCWGVFLRVPVLGELLRCFIVTRFSQALSLQLRSGILLTKALPEAAAATAVPPFEALIHTARQELIEGSNLSQCLENTGCFPPVLLGLLKAGEESGQLAASLKTAQDLTALELDTAYERFAATIQPLAMLIMGILVGAMLIATMLPMVEALNKL